MTVVDMAQWREENTGDEGVRCTCGSAWFELRNAVVTLNAERSIVGYAGELACADCGQPE